MGILREALHEQLRSVSTATREGIIATMGERIKRGEFSGKSETRKSARWGAKLMLLGMVETARDGELERLKSLIASLDALERKAKRGQTFSIVNKSASQKV